MDDNTVSLLFLGACALGLWLLFKLVKEKPELPAPETLNADGKPDPFLAAVSSERAAFNQQEAEETKRRLREIMDPLGDAADLKTRSRLKDFAQKNGLDKDLLELRWAIESYPRYAQEEGWQAHNAMGIDNPTMIDVPDGWGVQFDFEGTTYVMQVTKAENTLITIALMENGEEMFAIEMFNNSDRTGDVVAFKRRGTWAKALMTLIARHRAARTKLSDSLITKDFQKGKGRFEE